jgi:hypothetical protein
VNSSAALENLFFGLLLLSFLSGLIVAALHAGGFRDSRAITWLEEHVRGLRYFFFFTSVKKDLASLTDLGVGSDATRKILFWSKRAISLFFVIATTGILIWALIEVLNLDN